MVFGKYINKYYIRYGGLLILGILSLVLVDFMQLKVPEFYRTIVNGLNGTIPDFNMEYLLDKVCFPLVFVILSLLLGRFLWRVCFLGSALKVETDLRERLFSHAKNLSQKFYGSHKVGDLMSLFTNDLETIQDCFGFGVLMLFDALTLGTMSFVKMMRMNVYLTLFSLVPMAILVTIGIVMGKEMTKRWDARQAAFSKLSDFSQESFSGISVIKAFVVELKELGVFKLHNKNNEDTNVAYVKVSTLLNVLLTLFVESVFCVIFGFGGYLVKQNVFNAGDLIEFIGYFTSIVWPFMAISDLIDQTSRGKASLARITELLDEKIDVTDGPNVKEIAKPIKGKIEFRNLTFNYPDTEIKSLKNISFTIEEGENVGIIGKTGCGKSTIADILLRTYNVPDGTFFVDGIDANTIPIKYLRSFMAYVPQDNFLFSDTIRNNINFSGTANNEKEIENAAEISGVHKDISEFPDKYDTILGERGVTVSGGQKQRISIARALLKESAILILDDSVSAVDTDTEAKILSSLRTSRKGKTTIMVAHRVSTIKHMDKIIYMDDGKVSAVGSHQELFENCEDYRNTVMLQELEDTRRGDFNG